MEDSKIIALFFARSEQAIAELSNKYGGCACTLLIIFSETEAMRRNVLMTLT